MVPQLNYINLQTLNSRTHFVPLPFPSQPQHGSWAPPQSLVKLHWSGAGACSLPKSERTVRSLYHYCGHPLSSVFPPDGFRLPTPPTSSSSCDLPFSVTQMDSICTNETHISWKNRLHRHRNSPHQSDEEEDMLDLGTQILTNLRWDNHIRPEDLPIIKTLGLSGR